MKDSDSFIVCVVVQLQFISYISLYQKSVVMYTVIKGKAENEYEHAYVCLSV